VQRPTPLLDAARPSRHLAGDRWFVDETYVDVSEHRDITAARTFFHHRFGRSRRAGRGGHRPGRALANVIEDLLPGVWHITEQYANNRVECDHGRLKARLRPMRGLRTNRTASVAIRGHAFVQNLRRGHYNSEPTPHPRSGWPPRSTNSGPQSD
jgi:transposase-like protein